MRASHGFWLWTAATPEASPTVLGGFATAAAAAAWAHARGGSRLIWRDHPVVPTLGAATHAPVFVGQLDRGGWIGWMPHRAGVQWAGLGESHLVPAPSLGVLVEQVEDTGHPWRWFTPTTVWQARQAPNAPDGASAAWHLGTAPDGATFAWQPGRAAGTYRFVRTGPGTDDPPFLWPTWLDAARFLRDRGVIVHGFMPGAVIRAYYQVRGIAERRASAGLAAPVLGTAQRGLA
jgi:hypothetical protein